VHILVVGAGKMGGDVGLRFLRTGLDVTFFEHDPQRRTAFEAKLLRGMRRAAGEGEVLGRATVLQSPADAGTYDALYEAADEVLATKRAVVAEWAPRLVPDGLVLSNSSSILPSAIDVRCLGLHAFYPTYLTGFCEIVVPAGCPSERRRGTVALAARTGLKPIIQDEARAFAGNRLLLPVQDWALRAVRRGVDPEAVDAAAGRAWPGWEPLAMMDAIGLDTVANAVAAYRSRMEPDEASSYAALEEGLRSLVESGKRGGAARDGLRQGNPLPWPAKGAGAADLADDFEALFRNSCARLLARKDLCAADLALVLSGLFGVPYGPSDGDLTNPEGRARSERRARESGLSYWQTARGGA
jgi:3-hydroxyacyl-CoA dehydrogenase